MGEENNEWPEPSVPLYLYPRVAIPALVGGSIVQYIWLQYLLSISGFYNLMRSELSEISNSMMDFIALVLATATSRPEPNAVDILFEAIFAASTMILLLGILLLPIFLLGSVLTHPLDPSDSKIPYI